MSNNNLFFNSEEIRDIPLRTEFVTGPAGPTGNQGAAGVGITIGGVTGQVLAKKSNNNYDVEWVDRLSVVSWGTITGNLYSQTDLQTALDLKAPSTGISPSAISGTAVITTDTRLSDSRFPNGTATGDLSGTYPAPSVAKLQGYSVSATSPTTGQILQWGGSSWFPTAITGVSPSAISGTAVITTDARLSDARTPTAHASSHAVGGTDILTASAIQALGLTTDGYIIAQAGDNILTKYEQAKLLLPNGLPPSYSNRALLLLLPATYVLSAELQVNASFVDILAFPSNVIFDGFGLAVDCNNVNITGISAAIRISSTDSPIAENVTFTRCASGNNAFNAGFELDLSASFIDCSSGNSSFGYRNLVIGSFVNCIAGNYSFGSLGEAAGTFRNCSAADFSFGGGDAITSGLASGTFINCSGSVGCFGGGESGYSTGLFVDCSANVESFGQTDLGVKNGRYYNCSGISAGYSLNAPASGFSVQQNCNDTNGNIVEGFQST